MLCCHGNHYDITMHFGIFLTETETKVKLREWMHILLCICIYENNSEPIEMLSGMEDIHFHDNRGFVLFLIIFIDIDVSLNATSLN